MTTDNTTDPKLEAPGFINAQEALRVISEFCDQTQPFVGERFKKQLRNAIRAIPRSRATVAAPQGDAFTAYNQAIEDAKAAIRGEKVDDPYAAATFINAIARKCSPHVYVTQLTNASPTITPSTTERDLAYADGYNDGLRQGKQSRAPAPQGDASRKLTLPELNHLSALLEAERESGSYAGPREQYYARTERLIKWCNDQIGDK